MIGIHPFADGNGRSSRILTTPMLLRAGHGYAVLPAHSIAIVERARGAGRGAWYELA